MLGFRRHLLGSLPVIAAAAALACGGESLVIPPDTGTLQVTTSTSGTEPDIDGYIVQMDGGAEQAIGASASFQTEQVEPGTHTVQLAGVAPNCTVAGENPRTVSITAGATGTAAFEVTCSATTGSLQVSSLTSGPSPDPDGYSVNVDGSDRGVLPATGNLTVDGLTPGDHLVGLSGVAGNCQVQGDNPRTAAVTAAAGTMVAFAITCTAPPANAGNIRITTATTGADQDPNGYAFAIDGGPTQTIGINTSAPVTNIAAGPHTVRLSGFASNCTVGGTNPRAVDVSAGATAEVSFAVTCSASTGTIRVSAPTSGTPTDPDGYRVTLDRVTPSKPIPTGGSAEFAGVPAGPHSVTLSDLATNCSVAAGLSRDVAVTVGGTAEVSFAVTCVAPPRIAFVSDNPGVRDVFTVNPDGTDRSRLTDGLAGFAETPQWSPDRSKIVFEGGPSGGEIYVINADGSGLTNLTRTPSGTENETGPKWSPDGSRILFTKTTIIPGDDFDQELTDLYSMNAAGSNLIQLTTTGTEGRSGGYDWSPGGLQIAFESERDGLPQGVYVMSSSGGSPTRRSGAGVVSWAPDWSPDGGKIAFLSQPQAGGQIQVWAMNASDGSAQTQLTNQAGDDKTAPRWSPDGSKIVYMFSSSVGSSDIWTVNANGSGAFNVTSSGGDNTSPAWSPDGRQIAFVFGFGSGNAVVRVINADGTGLRANVSGRPSSSYRPDW